MADEKERPTSRTANESAITNTGSSPDDDAGLGKCAKIEIEDGGRTPTTASEDEATERSDDHPKRNVWELIWWLLNWTPKSLRYDPDTPAKLSLGLNLIYGIAGCVTVANLYYNQPILNKIAHTFDVSFEKASSVATLMQSGYAIGLLFLCPLGDILRRRPFILGLIAFTATAWLGLCVTSSFTTFSALSLICGVTTVTPQLMLPLVGDIAPLHRKGTALSIVVSGLMLGMLVARLLSGIVANWTDWRNIYWIALGLQYLLLGILFFVIPDYPSTNPEGLNYFKALWTIVYMVFTESVLVQACLIAFFISAVFTSFWTTLTFLLASPPYEYPSLTIGLFSFIGIAAICGGPVYSRFITDRFMPWYSSVLGLIITMVGIIVGTFTGNFTVAGPVIQATCIDMGIQTAQVANRAAIFNINPKARNRVNTAYMVAAFFGQLSGTAVGNRLYAQGGWTWSGGASIGFIGLSLVVCIAKGPREPGWIGWGGSWRLRRDDLPPKKGEEPESAVPTQDSSMATEEVGVASSSKEEAGAVTSGPAGEEKVRS